MLAVLRQRNFPLVWTAGLISLTGDWFLFIALPLVVYELSGSTIAGGMIFARIVPCLLLGSVAGVFVDRWDRRRTMFAATLAAACGRLATLPAGSFAILSPCVIMCT
jgi:MFS family permease